jgi:hypothetical protein
VFVEKQKPEDELNFESLKMYHGECHGGRIRICSGEDTILCCSRCKDEAILYSDNQKRYFINTAIDGISINLKFTVDKICFLIHQNQQSNCQTVKEFDHFYVEVKPQTQLLFSGIEFVRMRHISCENYGKIKVTRQNNSFKLLCLACKLHVELNHDSQINKIIKTSQESVPSCFFIDNEIPFLAYPGFSNDWGVL